MSFVNVVKKGETKSRIERFENLKEGDAVLYKGEFVVVRDDCHLSGDSTYDGYLFYGSDGSSYFPEDFRIDYKKFVSDNFIELKLLSMLETVQYNFSIDYPRWDDVVGNEFASLVGSVKYNAELSIAEYIDNYEIEYFEDSYGEGKSLEITPELLKEFEYYIKECNTSSTVDQIKAILLINKIKDVFSIDTNDSSVKMQVILKFIDELSTADDAVKLASLLTLKSDKVYVTYGRASESIVEASVYSNKFQALAELKTMYDSILDEIKQCWSDDEEENGCMSFEEFEAQCVFNENGFTIPDDTCYWEVELKEF